MLLLWKAFRVSSVLHRIPFGTDSESPGEGKTWLAEESEKPSKSIAAYMEETINKERDEKNEDSHIEGSV